MKRLENDIFNGAKFLPTLRDLKKLARSRGISNIIFIIFFFPFGPNEQTERKKKALIPPLEFSKNIPCRILPAPFLFLIFRIPPEVSQVL